MLDLITTKNFDFYYTSEIRFLNIIVQSDQFKENTRAYSKPLKSVSIKE